MHYLQYPTGAGVHAIYLVAPSRPSFKPYHVLLSTVRQSKNNNGWNKVLCFHLEVFCFITLVCLLVLHTLTLVEK